MKVKRHIIEDRQNYITISPLARQRIPYTKSRDKPQDRKKKLVIYVTGRR